MLLSSVTCVLLKYPFHFHNKDLMQSDSWYLGFYFIHILLSFKTSSWKQILKSNPMRGGSKKKKCVCGGGE